MSRRRKGRHMLYLYIGENNIKIAETSLEPHFNSLLCLLFFFPFYLNVLAWQYPGRVLPHPWHDFPVLSKLG